MQLINNYRSFQHLNTLNHLTLQFTVVTRSLAEINFVYLFIVWIGIDCFSIDIDAKIA